VAEIIWGFPPDDRAGGLEKVWRSDGTDLADTTDSPCDAQLLEEVQAGCLRKQSSERRRQAASRCGQEQRYGKVHEERLEHGPRLGRGDAACVQGALHWGIPHGLLNAPLIHGEL
jgi:hypothetical protein